MGLIRTAVVDGDRSVVVEVDECAQEHSREPWAVSARGMKPPVLAEGAIGVIGHVHL
jgi:hypothetical protein